MRINCKRSFEIVGEAFAANEVILTVNRKYGFINDIVKSFQKPDCYYMLQWFQR